MANLYWVLNIDLARSSNLKVSDDARALISRVLENTVRFFTANCGLDDRYVAWAGDGGFALFDTNDFTADTVLSVARSFATHVAAFVNRETLDIDFTLEPDYRITIGQVQVVTSSRLSNWAGAFLNLALKYERDFGRAGSISIWDDVYGSLGEAHRRGFVARSERVHNKTVYDLPVEKNMGVGGQLIDHLLAAKDLVDQTTLEWATKELVVLGSRSKRKFDRSLLQVFDTIFTYGELTKELLFHIQDVLDNLYHPITFRVSYMVPTDDSKSLEFLECTKACGAKNMGTTVPLDSRATAALAFAGGKPVFVASTKVELARPPSERVCERLYPGQTLKQCASLACFPITVGDDGGKEALRFSVVCVDTPHDGFFGARIEKTLGVGLDPLLREVALAEVIGNIIAVYSERVEPRVPRSAKRKTSR